MKGDNKNYATNKFLKPFLRISLSICSFVLAILISNLAFAPSANADGVKFCNDGNDTLYYVVAKEDGDGFTPPYDVKAWYYINPGSCRMFNLNSFGSHVYRAYVGFAQKDASGNIAMAHYLEKFREIPPGVNLTDQRICLNPKENFDWRNKLRNLQQCPDGFGLAKLSLLFYPGPEYFRSIPWVTIYLTTKKGAQLQSIISTTSKSPTIEKKPSPEKPLSLEMAVLIKKAEGGDAIAQEHLGDNYYNGKGVERDYEESFRWYFNAALQGNGDAQYALGYMYEKGRGVDKNLGKSKYWFSEAAKSFLGKAQMGDMDAQFYLGLMYNEGQGVERNYSEAAKWYKKAAEQDHPLAILMLENLKK